ncbi:hypothetical protein D3C72_1766070 [compost metagenome]
MHAGNQVRAHFQHEHRGCQHAGQDQVAFQCHALGILLFRRFLIDLGAAIDRVRRVADLVDRRHQCVDAGDAAHGRSFGGQVDTGLADARHRQQRALHAADAGRAGHAFHGQFGGCNRYLITHSFHCLNQGVAVDRARGADVRTLGGQVD